MRAAAVVAALVVCALSSPARADTAQEARDHYERGMAHYELGEFGAAVEEFKAAYARSQAPGLLFNLAQASRLNKDYEQALHFYRTYLRVRPDAPNRDDVEARITELTPIVEAQRRAEVDRLKAQERAVTLPPVDVKRPERRDDVVTPAVVVKAPPRNGKRERVAGLVVGLGGVALLGAGVGLGVAALDAQNKLSKLASAMGSWSPEQANLYSTGRNDAAAATALYVVGGVAVGTGVVLYAIGWKRDRAARFAVAPVPGGGAHAVWSWAF
jgi:tetratricopeptide (TPR) repeat protein